MKESIVLAYTQPSPSFIKHQVRTKENFLVVHLKIRDPVYCQTLEILRFLQPAPNPQQQRLPFCFLAQYVLPAALGCTKLQPTPAPEWAAISFDEKSEFFATFPATDTLLFCSGSEEGEERRVPANSASFCSELPV